MRRLGRAASVFWCGSASRTAATSRKSHQKGDATGAEKQEVCASKKPVVGGLCGDEAHRNGVFRFDVPSAVSVYALPRDKKSANVKGWRPKAKGTETANGVPHPELNRHSDAAQWRKAAPRQRRFMTTAADDFSAARQSHSDVDGGVELTLSTNGASPSSRLANIRVIRLV